MLKMYFIPKTHGREDAFYAQNCIKKIIGNWNNNSTLERRIIIRH